MRTRRADPFITMPWTQLFLRIGTFFGLPIILAHLLVGTGASSAHAEDELDALLPETPDAPTPGPPAEQPGQNITAPKADPARMIEEIVVTAQKREERLQDVPISISVLDEIFIREQSITDFRDLGHFVPNVMFDPTGTFPDIRMRGFGSQQANKAFEQSVGLVVDGIPYGRLPYWQAPLFDLERVEVLRGPQGTLFGKNTTAGLVNVVTKKPTEEYTGRIDLEFGELDRRRFEGAIGGPLWTDVLEFRLSAVTEERDGFVENTTARVAIENPRMNGREREAIRAQLGLPNVFGTELVLGYEMAHVETRGAGWEFRRVEPNLVPFFREWDPNTDFAPDNFVGSIDGPPDRPELRESDIDTFFANARYSLGSWGLNGIVGHSVLKELNNGDSDFTPAPIAWLTDDRSRNPQTSVELRIDSPELPGLVGVGSLFDFPLGSSAFTAGFFFADHGLTSQQPVSLNLPVVAQFAAAQNTPTGEVPPLQDFIGEAVPIGELGVFDTRAGAEQATVFFDQETTSLAGYGQMDWRFFDPFSLQAGLRLTDERKSADIERRTTQGAGVVLSGAAGEEFSTSLSQSELQLTPKVGMKYDWSDDLSVFATWTKGFKSGGFNEAATRQNSLEFQPETTTAWEIGTKTNLLDRTARLNVQFFYQTVNDLQVRSVNPRTLLLSIENAGEARVRGIELDSAWLPTDWLTLTGALGFNDSEFLDFPFGECAGDRENTDGDDDPRCDLTGGPMPRTPKWTSSLTSIIRYPLASFPGLGSLPAFARALDLVLGGAMEYRDVNLLGQSLDPRTRQPSFFRFGAHVGVANSDQRWSVRIVAENLTDEATSIQARDITLGQGSFAQLPEAPRLIFGNVRWEF